MNIRSDTDLRKALSAAGIRAVPRPLIAEAVVAYYAWQASGSKINGYSIWLLAWILLLLVVVGLAAMRKRLQKN